jgi:predicted nuclease of predicted toxin-antitoxin system
VRLLIDANLSPRIAVALGKAGLESIHVRDVGMLTAPDRSILAYAVAGDLEAGAVVTITRGRMRIRSLPIVPAD